MYYLYQLFQAISYIGGLLIQANTAAYVKCFKGETIAARSSWHKLQLIAYPRVIFVLG